jgi:hypothetical protein
MDATHEAAGFSGRALGDSFCAWEPVVSLLASAFYLAAMVQVLRRRRSATGLFFAGLVLSVGLWVQALAQR